MFKTLSMKKLIKHCLMLVCVMTLTVNLYSQNEKITLNIEGKPVRVILKEIEKQCSFTFVFSGSTINSDKITSIKVNNERLEDLLKIICKEINSEFSFVGKQIILAPSKETPSKDNLRRDSEIAKSIEIKGRVLDERDLPLTGAVVTVDGNNRFFSVSDSKGEFNIKVNETAIYLTVNIMGYDIQRVILQKGKNNYEIKLLPKAIDLDEVMVIGYGTTTVRDLTGSIASINSKDISNRNVINATSLIQNMAAGVQVSQSTGRPGENVRVRVRGATSLTGSNEPLYVIDGVPMDDSFPLNGISPSDIESIDILKDASAAAIYGSRAANGVVIVTTKKGRPDEKASFSFNYFGSTDMQIENFRLLEGDEFRAYVTDIARKTLVVNPSNKTAISVLNPTSGALGSASTNWFNEVKQPAARHNFDISASGGTKTNNYFISASVLDQVGMVRGDDQKRYNARVNFDVNITPKLKIGTRNSASFTKSNASGTSMFTAQGFRPDLPVYDSNGGYFYLNSFNPVANLNRINRSESYRFNGLIYGELEIIKGLILKSSLAGTADFSYNYSFTPSYLNTSKNAFGSERNSKFSKTVFDNTLSYKREIDHRNYIDAVVGISFENSASRGSYLAKSKYALDEIYTNVASGTDFSSASSTASGRGLQSSFFRANYRFDDKYLATFSARYDGSSMFGVNNRFGFFPSVALAWRINKESFLKDIREINDLKLKISAGKTGVQNMSEYANRNLYTSGEYNDSPAILHSQLSNDNIRWERSNQYDAALDFALFGYRLSGTLGVYQKDTKDLIWSYAFPSTMAVGSIFMNIGSVRNRGIEMNIKGVVIDKEDLKLELSLNMAHNKNTVTSLVPQGAIVNSSGTTVHGSGSQILAVGYPMGSFFGYEYNGIIKDQQRITELNDLAKSKGNSYYDGNALYIGHLEYRDMNEDGIINTRDQTILGSPDPDLFGGLTAALTWKNFNLFANFGYQIGGKKLYGKALQNLPAQLTGLVDYNLYNRWSPDNPDAVIPATYLEEGVSRTNRLSIFDASYLRLQDLRITYTLPKMNFVNAQGQIYISASNLFTITSYPGVDPATVNTFGNYGGNYESSYPGLRTLSLGVKLNF